jgi:autotransporter translocation and assembly factor TamB
VLLLLIIAAAIYTNTEGFRRMVRDQVLEAINSGMRGSVTLDRIEGPLWGDLTIHDIRLRYQDSDILAIPRVRLAVSLLPLLFGQIQLTYIEASDPVVLIARDAEGRWNIAEAVASDTPSDSQIEVLLKSLMIRGGDLTLRFAGEGPSEYHVRDLDLQGSLAARTAGVEFEAGAASARLETRELPALNLKGGLAYQDTGPVPVVKINRLRVESANSQLSLSGQLADFDKMQIDVKAAIERLAPADIVRFVPQWPVKQPITGTLALKGRPEDLAVVADLESAGAKFAGDFVVDAVAPAPRYRGTVKVASFGIHRVLGLAQFDGVLDGNAEVEGVGADLDRIQGGAKLALRSVRAMDWALGDLGLAATLRDRRVALNGELNGSIGGATLRGDVMLANEPNYDFDLSVSNLDVKSVAAQANMDGTLNFKGKFQGTGITLARMMANAQVEILPSSVGPVELRAGELIAAIAGERIRIARAALNTDDTTLLVSGDIGTSLNQRGKLDYDLRSENLTPWLTLAGRNGSGAAAIVGNVQGNLEAMTSRGTLKAGRLLVDGIAIGNGSVDFDLSRKADQTVPDGRLTARLANIRAGAELQKLDAKIALVSTPTQLAEIDAAVQDQFGRLHHLKGSVDYSQADINARLTQLSLNLPGGSWSLVEPTSLMKRGDAFVVQNLRLRSRDSEAAIDGYVATAGPQALSVALDKLPLETVAALLPNNQPKLTGLATLQAKIGGTASAPQIASTLKLTDTTVGGQRYAGLTADVNYAGRDVDLNVVIRQDASHSLNAVGKLPLVLSWQDGWRSELVGDMDLRVKSSGLSLAFLNAYTQKTLSDIAGEISLDVAVRGTPSAPSLNGTFRLADGRLKAIPLNVDVTGIALEGAVAPRAVTVKSFIARANDGQISGNGSLSLKSYELEDFKLTLAARRWPAINTKRYQAQLNGDVVVAGPLTGPKLTGKIEVIEANVRPDLAFLARSSTPALRDQTIVVISRKNAEQQAPTPNKSNGGATDSDLFKNLTLDLTVHVPRNFWVRHPDAAVEFRGNVHATKAPGQEPQLVGLIETIRGWAGFQGRRFDLVRGEIRFVGGGKIDPALDIEAQHRLPQYTVYASVGGTAEKPTLALRSDPTLDQADILALLIFGKPTKELSGGEQVSLKQSAADVASGFAAATIGSAVAEAIGLDSVGGGDLSFDGGRVGYGRYVGERTYVTVGQDLSGEKGQEVTVQYQISRDWKIESSTASKGMSEVGIIWHRRY